MDRDRPMNDGEGATLVCGGGGVWGVAWMTGLCKGIADLGLDLCSMSSFVGTSAGSVVASNLLGPFSIVELYERQTVPELQPFEKAPAAGGIEALMTTMASAGESQVDRLHAIRALAMNAATISHEERLADIRARLGRSDDAWPDKPLKLTAVDMETLELTVFDSSSGVALPEAVAASCAVPGVWPPAQILGRSYIDGGVWRTAENAHLASTPGPVVILSPLGQVARMATRGSTGLDEDVQQLRRMGSRVVVIEADGEALKTATLGVLDPATRRPAAEAGRRQAETAIDAIAGVLGA